MTLFDPDALKDERLQLAARAARLVAFDFDGVFTDNAVYVDEQGHELVRCSRSDGLGLRVLEACGREPIILSGESNPVVGMRARKLKVHCIQACADKRQALATLVAERQLEFGQVAFVGNDVNDLGCLQAAGFPIVVCDAHPDVLGHALYRTRTRGGHGAVREVCDLFAALLGVVG